MPGTSIKGISAKLLYSDAKSDPVLTLDNNKLTVRVMNGILTPGEILGWPLWMLVVKFFGVGISGILKVLSRMKNIQMLQVKNSRLCTAI